MLASNAMRVALVTTHLPLKDVSTAITSDTIKSVTRALKARPKTPLRLCLA